MTRPQRTLVVLTTTLALALGFTAPAWAGLTDKSPRLTAGISTVRVVSPSHLNTRGTSCWTTTYTTSYNGVTTTRTTTTLHARLSWDASTTPRVASYVITAYGSGWSTVVAEVPAPATTASTVVDGGYADQNIRVSVTARTDYGWTAESDLSGVIKC